MKPLAALTTLALMASVAAAVPSDPYTGVWKLNLAKSGGDTLSSVKTTRRLRVPELLRSLVVSIHRRSRVAARISSRPRMITSTNFAKLLSSGTSVPLVHRKMKARFARAGR